MERLLTGYGLIEAPTIEDSGALLFSDAVQGGVRRLSADGTVENVIEHRKGIGGLAIHATGGFVVSGRNVVWKRSDGETVVLIERQNEIQTFNDLGTDPDGRIYVGSVEFNALDVNSKRAPGDLYLIDLDGSVRVVAPDVQLSNGIAVSPDGRALYHSDSEAHAVWRYDRDSDGSLNNRRPLHQWDSKQPDGLAVAADGSVWVAIAYSGEVLGIDEHGTIINTIPVEVPMVTSVCFGGEGLRQLYIVTGDVGAPPDVRGGVYRMPAPVAGLPVPPARVQPRV